MDVKCLPYVLAAGKFVRSFGDDPGWGQAAVDGALFFRSQDDEHDAEWGVERGDAGGVNKRHGYRSVTSRKKKEKKKKERRSVGAFRS